MAFNLLPCCFQTRARRLVNGLRDRADAGRPITREARVLAVTRAGRRSVGRLCRRAVPALVDRRWGGARGADSGSRLDRVVPEDVPRPPVGPARPLHRGRLLGGGGPPELPGGLAVELSRVRHAGDDYADADLDAGPDDALANII